MTWMKIKIVAAMAASIWLVATVHVSQLRITTTDGIPAKSSAERSKDKNTSRTRKVIANVRGRIQTGKNCWPSKRKWPSKGIARATESNPDALGLVEKTNRGSQIFPVCRERQDSRGVCVELISEEAIHTKCQSHFVKLIASALIRSTSPLQALRFCFLCLSPFIPAVRRSNPLRRSGQGS